MLSAFKAGKAEAYSAGLFRTYRPRTLASSGRDCLMMIYHEKIAPPLAPLTDEEQTRLRLDAIETEDRWVKNFVDRLAGVRDLKH
jgi:hypothetical protein